jgi:hypothetical protein
MTSGFLARLSFRRFHRNAYTLVRSEQRLP